MQETRREFSLQERDRRWARLRELMAGQHVDVLVVFPQNMPGDALYVANRPGAVVFPLVGDPTLIIARPDPRPSPHAWIRDVRGGPASAIFAPYGEGVAARLRELGADGKRIAVAGLSSGKYTLVRQAEGIANHTSVTRVREALPRATVVDGTPIMTEARYVKSEEEIDAIRRSVQIAEASADALAEHARPGVSEAEVYASMIYEQVRRGAFPPHVAWLGGLWGDPAPRTVGPPPHAIQQGWFMNNEIEPAVQGYTCQIDQPVCVGPMPPMAREMQDLGRAAFERACELMRPGTSWGEVVEKVEALGNGTRFQVGFLLHGRGLGDDGPLIVPGYPHDHVKDDPIRADTVFVLKPHARVEGASYNVTWGDSVVVRTGGAQRLGTRPYAVVSAS